MEKFTYHKGIVAPLDRVNVDTDMIIPKQFLKKIERTGFGKHLFHELRFVDYEGKNENPDFILNREPFRQATVLLARDNFGCGSSREHAPWALLDYGFRVVIAPSFADIFYNNCLNNGILLITLNSYIVDKLFKDIEKHPGAEMGADLKVQEVIDRNGVKYDFNIKPFHKKCLLNGLTPIEWTEQHKNKIDLYEEKMKKEKPWLK